MTIQAKVHAETSTHYSKETKKQITKRYYNVFYNDAFIKKYTSKTKALKHIKDDIKYQQKGADILPDLLSSQVNFTDYDLWETDFANMTTMIKLSTK